MSGKHIDVHATEWLSMWVYIAALSNTTVGPSLIMTLFGALTSRVSMASSAI